VLAAEYPAFDEAWRAWKQQWLGAPDARVHEPAVRTRSGLFFDRDVERSQARIDALEAQLASLPFVCIAAAIDKRRFADAFLTGHVDDFLPRSMYLVCVDFILERFTHFLCHVGNGAQGSVHAESRGLREDAEVHFEYVRLRLDGTQFCPPSQFRGYLRPAMQFERKVGNSSGLQIADLMARPIAEKVLNPAAAPERWGIVSSKFYDGTKDRRGNYGLKILPALVDDLFGEYPEKTTGDAEASPVTD
jgi:hypothetical protein